MDAAGPEFHVSVGDQAAETDSPQLSSAQPASSAHPAAFPCANTGLAAQMWHCGQHQAFRNQSEHPAHSLKKLPIRGHEGGGYGNLPIVEGALHLNGNSFGALGSSVSFHPSDESVAPPDQGQHETPRCSCMSISGKIGYGFHGKAHKVVTFGTIVSVEPIGVFCRLRSTGSAGLVGRRQFPTPLPALLRKSGNVPGDS